MHSQDFYIDTDKDGKVVGIEIWSASKNAIQPLSKDIAQEVKATLEKCA